MVSTSACRDTTGFVLAVRGRAGEPAPGAHVHLSLSCAALLPQRLKAATAAPDGNGEVVQLQTGTDGCIRLGPLPHVSDIWATLAQLPNSRAAGPGR